MKTKETIAIIGATGNIGAAIARNLSRDNYRLVLMSSDVPALGKLKSSLSTSDPKAMIDTNDCAKEVAWEADIIILTCAYKVEQEIIEKIREVAIGKILISISNPFDVNYSDLVRSTNTSAAEELQKLLPHSKVVKVFNMTPADNIDSATSKRKSDAFIATNNGNALDVISRVIASAGFNPVVVGDLSVSRSLERMHLTHARLGINGKFKKITAQGFDTTEEVPHSAAALE